jgi:hypothetical protein
MNFFLRQNRFFWIVYFFLSLTYQQTEKDFSVIQSTTDQTESSSWQSVSIGNHTVLADPDFFQSLAQWRVYSNPTLAGYRIQVSFYSRHEEAKNNLIFFKEKFQHEFAELDYKQPYHRLRVGIYRNKVDAVKDLKEYIKKGYNGAFIVKTRIPLKDIYPSIIP